MHIVRELPLDIHSNLREAYAQLHQSIESYLVCQQRRIVPEDTAELDFTRQAEESLLDYIQTNLAPQPTSGCALQDGVTYNSRILETGCESIDQLLCGGIREGQITELVGHSSTGKTQVCLQLAAITALRDETVLYIDTTGNFSSKRIGTMVAAAARSSGQQSSEPFKNVHVLKCHEIEDLLASLVSLDEQTKQQVENGHASGRVRLVIIDSIAGPISPVLGGGPSFQGHSLMMETATCLKQIAARHNFAVVVTNHMSAVPGGNERPALGESWRNQPHTRVLLSRQDPPEFEGSGGGEREPQRKATLLASLLAPTGSTSGFCINADGVFGKM